MADLRHTVVVWSLRRDRYEALCFSEDAAKANALAEQLRLICDLSVRVVETVDDVDQAVQAMELLHVPNLTESEGFLACVDLIEDVEFGYDS